MHGTRLRRHKAALLIDVDHLATQAAVVVVGHIHGPATQIGEAVVRFLRGHFFGPCVVWVFPAVFAVGVIMVFI